MTMPALRPVFLVLTLALALSACGGSPSGDPGPGTGPESGLVPDPGALMVGSGQTSDGQPTVTLKDGRVVTMLRLQEIGYVPAGSQLVPAPLRAQETPLPTHADLRANSSFGRDQNPRGTCIVFSNVAALEAAYKRLYGVALDLSEQYLNAVRRTMELPAPSVAAVSPLPRAENLPASWGSGGSYDTQINYMRLAGIPREEDAPYVASADYENTTQAGDQPQTPTDWTLYRNGTVTQRALDDFNLSSVRPQEYRVPGPLTLTTLPVAALERATFRATAVTRASAAERRTLDWFRRQLAAGREVVFDFAGGWRDPMPDNGVWDPPATDRELEYGHSMLMVGYDDARQAFLIKNSWGESAPSLFSYAFVTRGLVQEAHVFTAVADPAAGTPTAPLFLGRWSLHSEAGTGRLDIYHFPELYAPSELEGTSDKRLGTYFPLSGPPLRVNGAFTGDALDFNFDAATPNLPYDDRGRGLQFAGARLDAAHTRLTGTVTLPGGRRVPFTAVKDNIGPEISLTIPAALANRDVTLHADVVADEEGSDCCTYAWSPRPHAASPRGATYRFSSPGSHPVQVTVTDRFGASSLRSGMLNVLNGVPTAQLQQPTEGAAVFVGRPLHLQGVGSDPNAGPGPGPGEVPCEQLSWRSSLLADTAFPRSGCSADVWFDTPGVRTLTLRVTDPDDPAVTGETSVTVTVTAAPVNQPPEVRLTVSAPTFSGGTYDAHRALTLEVAATDPEGDLPLTFGWTAAVLHDSGETALAEREIGTGERLTWTPVALTGLSSLPECNTYAGARLRLSAQVTDRLGHLSRLTQEVRVVCVPQ
ncbi:MAG: peptidase papain [Deinococcus sp.]|nr:peptidase papain [Deinococcus sp.]